METKAEQTDLISEILDNPMGPEVGNPVIYDLAKMVEEKKITAGDKKFIENILCLSKIDPEIVKRVLVMRKKLQMAMKLTQTEANELIESFRCKSFPGGLDISGYVFGELNLGCATIHGNYNSSHVEVRGNCNEDGLTIKGHSHEENKTIKGNSCESAKTIEGNSHEQGKRIGGNSLEREKIIEGDSFEQDKTIGGDSFEQNKIINRDSYEKGKKIKGDKDERGKIIKGERIT